MSLATPLSSCDLEKNPISEGDVRGDLEEEHIEVVVEVVDKVVEQVVVDVVVEVDVVVDTLGIGTGLSVDDIKDRRRGR